MLLTRLELSAGSSPLLHSSPGRVGYVSCVHAAPGFSWGQAMVFESYYCFVPTWPWDQLYQHSLDCVILAWASCPIPAPGSVCHPSQRGQGWNWSCDPSHVKKKTKNKKQTIRKRGKKDSFGQLSSLVHGSVPRITCGVLQRSHSSTAGDAGAMGAGGVGAAGRMRPRHAVPRALLSQ